MPKCWPASSVGPGELIGYGAITASHAGGTGAGRYTVAAISDSIPPGRVAEVSPRGLPPGTCELGAGTSMSCADVPGCRRVATTAALAKAAGNRHPNGVDLDHTVSFPQGSTVSTNLAALCCSHHLLKTHTEWRVEQDAARGPSLEPRHSGCTFFTYPHASTGRGRRRAHVLLSASPAG